MHKTPIIPGELDAVTETDWAEHWRRLVEARAATTWHQPGYWERRAPAYAKAMAARRDGVPEALEPWLDAKLTLIDVGAGTGRFAAPLADRLEWVTAVEPSEGMRAQIPQRDNMTVVASSWQDAEVAPADLALCAHVLYGVLDLPPFIRKLEAAARRRVFVVIRARQTESAAKRLAEALGNPPPRQPELIDLLLVLRQMGVDYELTTLRYGDDYVYPSLEDALEEARSLAGEAWDGARARSWLEANLERRSDGAYVDRREEMVSGLVHWRPTASS